MNKNSYIKNTMKRIKCSGSKKKEIKKQLEADIDIRLDQGETIDKIVSEMGSPKEIADGFNENLSSAEKRKYRTGKIIKIIVPLFIIFAILIGLVYWFLPKSAAIEDSQYFDRTQMEDTMKETVALLDENDYEALKAMSTQQMGLVFTEETITNAKNNISGNFGQQVSYGSPYVVEIIQCGTHYAVGEVTVSYENVSVTYRLTYDENMRLAGLYMR